jgi:hypothetical protein
MDCAHMWSRGEEEGAMGVWQGVTMDSLKFHPGPPCPTLSTPGRWATPEMALCRAAGLRPSSILLDTPRRTPIEGTTILRILVAHEGEKTNRRQTRISWDIHGFPKVLLGPGMPVYSTPCGWTSLKRSNGRFRDGHPQGGWAMAVSLPPWIPPCRRA